MGYLDNLRELRSVTLVGALALCIASCGPLKPEVSTIVMHDTIYTDRVVADTIVVTQPQDTIVMEKERLRVRVVRINDTLRIEGECEADTIYRTTTIEVPVKVVESRWPWWARPVLWAVCVLAFIYAVKRIVSF